VTGAAPRFRSRDDHDEEQRADVFRARPPREIAIHQSQKRAADFGAALQHNAFWKRSPIQA
jgi:hypothetical protein